MSEPIQTPDRLFDRTWRPGHPYRPRLSGTRRLLMAIVFLILCGLIGAYWYFTNSNRVRQQAEDYLSDLTGGHVSVGAANLSIFEGLRLYDVRVFVDPAKPDDSQIFSASTFLIQYSPAALILGRIEATRIVAIDPRVRLIEDVKTHQWNYSQLGERRMPRSAPGTSSIVPEVALRNAMIDYLESGNPNPIGSATIDGQLSPGSDADHYNFKLQSRGSSQSVGPHAEGNFDINTGDVQVTLNDLQFGPDLRVMLPAKVQQWWQDHKLAGAVKRTELHINPSNPSGPFQAAINIEDVALSVQPEELLSQEEMQTRRRLNQAFDVMRTVGLNDSGFIDHLSNLIAANPITLTHVDGKFTFTQDGVNIDALDANLNDNRFSISGHYDGYSNDAAATFRVTNAAGKALNVPPVVKFINSLPPEVREVYARFRPQGTCSIAVQYVRASQGAKPEVTGELNVFDGTFIFDKFAYPLSKASGKIFVERDDKTGEQRLRIERIRGHGLPGGPNQNALIEIEGQMQPLTQSVEVNMTVRGRNLSSEPALLAAFSPRTRKALTYFDSAGKGDLPKFSGGFVCTIHRFPEIISHWNISTAIHLDDATGSLVSFPYPMEHGTGDLVIYDDHIQIKQIQFKHGPADMTIKGRVDWGSDSAGDSTAPRLRPALTVTASNVPIDSDLMAAIPPIQAKWLDRLGAKGAFDLTGTVGNNVKSASDFAFEITPHDWSVWPVDDLYAITAVNGTLKLTPQKLTLVDLHGKRGDADVSAHGEVSWPTSPPQMSIVAEAKNLALDPTLFDLLPENAQKGWTQVQPEGTVDAQITFSGAPPNDTVASAVDVAPASQPAGQNFVLTLTPRNLSITPHAAPYRLDQLTGTVSITPTTVKMQNIAGHHGSAEVHFSGTGATDPSGVWDMQINGSKMLVDNDLLKAVPSGLQSVLRSSQMAGTIAFELSRIKIWADTNPTTAPTTAPIAAAMPDPSGSGSALQPPAPTSTTDVDFTLKLATTDASINPGVPLSNLSGVANFNGSVRLGELTDLSGDFDIPTMNIAGRTATNVRAELVKRPGQDAMKLAQIQAQLVGGQLAGQIDWTYPDNPPSRYAMALVLHDADIKTLTGDIMPDARGTLSASLSMEGDFNDATSRRGGGDVAVSGDQLYKMPLILGLLQVTNLSLPITSPFNEGTCKYTIDGTRVTFESIELRAKDMMVSGNGHLDFDTGRVGLSFTSQSDISWLKVPVVTDLLQGARNELLRIHIRGTITQPQVSTSSMNTFVTTVDEIFKGGNPPPDLPPVKKPKKPK